MKTWHSCAFPVAATASTAHWTALRFSTKYKMDSNNCSNQWLNFVQNFFWFTRNICGVRCHLVFCQGPTALALLGLLYEGPRSHSDSSHSVGRLWTSDRLVADKKQHSQETDIHAHGGIRNLSLSRRVPEVPRQRPRGHWDMLFQLVTETNYSFSSVNQKIAGPSSRAV